MAKQTITMDDLLENVDVKQLSAGEVVDAKVITVAKHQLWLDLGANGVGFVPRREIGYGKTYQVGDEVSASVIDPEIEDGQALLSLRRAAKDKGWDEVIKLFEAGDSIEVNAYDANRGGLLVELEGVRGFLPVSQLSSEHYPRVSSSDKDEILNKLNQLTDKPLEVRILDADKRANKLIFSEKEAVKEKLESKFQKLSIGDEVEGVVTGVVDFGAFINVDGIEGLVHISEISWERVENPKDYLKVNDRVKAKIIAIDNDKLSLSIKQTQDDPWATEAKDIKKGSDVEGKITRITPFGAFVQLSPSVEALVHVSELGDSKNVDPEKLFKLEEVKQFKVVDIDRSSRKISLSL